VAGPTPDGTEAGCPFLRSSIELVQGALRRLSVGRPPGSRRQPSPFEDSVRLYQFDQYGRHLRTREAAPGAVLLTFGYDSAGRVVTITDADRNVTTTQRNVPGATDHHCRPVRAADDADPRWGYLACVTDPGGNRHG
jgi:YD repeat-containing protein